MDVAATVKRLMDAHGWKQAELAEAIGASQPSVGRWLSGKSFPQGEHYVKLMELAAALDTDTPIDQATPINIELISTPVSAKAGAGLFREADEFENQDADFALVPRDPRFPQARILVFDVTGTSMNAFTPPIPDGARVSGPAFEDIEGRVRLKSGAPVVVQRRSADGQMLEFSVKELELRDDGFTFHPRSTDSRHKAIVVDGDLRADDGKSVEIVALVTEIIIPTRW